MQKQTSDFLFIGIRGSVIALDPSTGARVWATHLKGAGFVNVVLERQAVVASCDGEIFCLDPLTGDARWHNPLKGFGTGLATIATPSNPTSATAPVWAEKRRRDEEQAAAGAATAGAT